MNEKGYHRLEIFCQYLSETQVLIRRELASNHAGPRFGERKMQA